MRLPTGLLLGAAVMLGIAVVTGQAEIALPALLLGGASAGLKIAARGRDLQASLTEMEHRLNDTEGELGAASSELEQLRVASEFDRQLLHPPATPPTS